MNPLITQNSETVPLTRRRALLLCAVGIGSLAGCLSDTDDDTVDEPGGTLHVNASVTIDQPVQLQVALVEEGATVEESVIGTYHLRHGDGVEETYEEIQGGPFRVVVRIDEDDRRDEWDNFEKEWDINECIELMLQPTVSEEELGVVWSCTHPV